VDANAYKIGDRPYLLSQVTQAALDDLKRKKAARKAAPVVRKAVIDPEAARQKAEAHALMNEARKRNTESLAKANQMEAEAKEDAAK
jgi:hypothetical protein